MIPAWFKRRFVFTKLAGTRFSAGLGVVIGFDGHRGPGIGIAFWTWQVHLYWRAQ